MKFNQTDFTISQHFATVLEYGDYGDMDKDEIKQFEEWEHDAKDGKTGHWSIIDMSENFTKCEVTGLHSNCMIVAYMALVKEKTK